MVPDDFRVVDELVAGFAMLPCEKDPRREVPTEVRGPVHSVHGEVASARARDAYTNSATVAAWDSAVLEVRNERRAGVLAVPAGRIGDFYARLDAGEVDDHFMALLVAVPGGGTLSSREQAVAGGWFDTLESAQALAPPERDADGVLVTQEPARGAQWPLPTAAAPPQIVATTTAEAPAPAASAATTSPRSAERAESDEEDRPRFGKGIGAPPPPLISPASRFPWTWFWIISLLVALVIAGAIALFGGGEDSVAVPTPPAVAPSTATTTTTTTTTTSPPVVKPEPPQVQPPPPEPEPTTTTTQTPIDLPPQYAAIIEALRDLGLTDLAILDVLDKIYEDAMDDGIYSIEGEIPGAFDETVDIWDMAAFLDFFENVILNPAFNESTFECGERSDGRLTICHPAAADIPEGDLVVVAVLHAGDLPVEGDESIYTYAAVFDSDRDDADNFNFVPPFNWDYFRDTDRWYQLHWFPGEGWRLVASVWTGDFPQRRSPPTPGP